MAPASLAEQEMKEELVIENWLNLRVLYIAPPYAAEEQFLNRADWRRSVVLGKVLLDENGWRERKRAPPDD